MLAAGGLATPAPAATTFTVNSTGDQNDADYPGGGFDGASAGKCDVDAATAGKQCTLRAAIQEADGVRGADTIAFAIPGGSVQTITPASVLPTIRKRVTINGYTQPGASPNTETDPTKTNAQLTVQITGSKSGVHLEGPGSVVKGLSITGCTAGPCTWALALLGGRDHRVQGNFIGAYADGTTAGPNNIGVLVSGRSGSKVGGGKPAARNLIVASTLLGVYVNATADNTVQGNLIGLDRNGDPLSNSGDGIAVVGPFADGNRFLSNSIFGNGGLGIDLNGGTTDSYGVTANDPDNPTTPDRTDPDTDTGTNDLQNHPVLSGAQLFEDPFGDTALGGGTLDSVRSTRKREEEYIIEFFVGPAQDPSGYGEGRVPAGQIVVTTDDRGHASFNFSVGSGVDEGDFITATATRARTGDTSEFSGAVVVQPPVIGP
jgi:hypothetical protein